MIQKENEGRIEGERKMERMTEEEGQKKIERTAEEEATEEHKREWELHWNNREK